jgi:hypothetical protein
VPALAGFCYPDFEHNPACLPEVPQHVDAMVKGEVRLDGPVLPSAWNIAGASAAAIFRLIELLVGQRAAGWVVPELKAPAMTQESNLMMLNKRKQPSNLLEEGNRPERLGEDWTRYIPVCGNAGHEQYGRWRLEAGKVGGEFHAVHHR